ncbi:MAG: response regulator [Candidatus Pristimantibacillus sp.]
MKVLIVDDEKHVRNAINLLADWDRHGITEVLQASNGEDAVTIIQEHMPQIVLTDMRMPRKDGAELLTWLYANRPQIKAMVISGYDDFEYVRHAVRNGGIDYILKPVKADALNEALSKAVDCWRKEEEGRQRFNQQSIEVNEMKPHYADKLLTDLVTGQGRRDLLSQLCEEFKFPLSLSSCSVAVLSLSQLDRRLLSKFQNNQLQLLFFILTNICNELLKSRGIAFRQLNRSEEIVILFWDDRTSFNSMLADINEGIYITLHRRVHFGIAAQRTFPDDMPRAYLEASKALWRRNLLESGNLHSLLDEGSQSTRPLRLTAYEEQLRLTALSGNREQIEAVTKQWLEDVRQQGSVTPEQLIQWEEEWDWMQLQWLEGEQKGPNAGDSEESQSSALHPLPLNEEGLLAWEDLRIQMENRLGVASKILTQRHSKDNFFIHDIAKYIESHYQEDISLQDIAARFFLSREYIARKFKQEYSVTLLDYLSRIRIEKAKLLLHNPHLRIAQIAEMVGYQDEKYFSRVFKKLEGINPGEYRKDQTLG